MMTVENQKKRNDELNFQIQALQEQNTELYSGNIISQNNINVLKNNNNNNNLHRSTQPLIPILHETPPNEEEEEDDDVGLHSNTIDSEDDDEDVA